ncbi:glycosyltransferase family protein [Roseivivax isoporae]|uniref:CgeB family protein n=1 Tax=Roseivivax isoporae TaxID=591206 RepID=UPI0005C1C80C
MRFVFYTHSLVSDWNHGNAHFLRGILRALEVRGHHARALEPADGWSRRNLVAAHGDHHIDEFGILFPDLGTKTYGPRFDHEEALEDADVVVVHEWTDPALVARLGRARARGARFRLLFHDTHHRAVSDRPGIAGLDLDGYDGVLAFGAALREEYLRAGWGRQVFTWHEAADVSVFRPMAAPAARRDLVWIGNWGDGERGAELEEFLVRPAAMLSLDATVHGVRYPDHALKRLDLAGIDYRGWVPNVQVPEVFAAHRVTVHIPRRPYVETLPGIPTIRPFEALACGIPLISAPWDDAEGLFREDDMRRAGDGAAMRAHLRELLSDPEAAEAQAARGLETIRARHTCGHRVEELFDILAALGTAAPQNREIIT